MQNLMLILISILQAEPLFKDKNQFTVMADPLLEGNYPLKSLYQALAVAAMCLQEEADTRPFIADVVTALEYLAEPKIEEQSDKTASKNSPFYANSVKEENFNHVREA